MKMLEDPSTWVQICAQPLQVLRVWQYLKRCDNTLNNTLKSIIKVFELISPGQRRRSKFLWIKLFLIFAGNGLYSPFSHNQSLALVKRSICTYLWLHQSLALVKKRIGTYFQLNISKISNYDTILRGCVIYKEDVIPITITVMSSPSTEELTGQILA